MRLKPFPKSHPIVEQMNFEVFFNDYLSHKTELTQYQEAVLKNCCEIYSDYLKQRIALYRLGTLESDYTTMLRKKLNLQIEMILVELEYQMNSVEKEKTS
jgi:hypothetical protein